MAQFIDFAIQPCEIVKPKLFFKKDFNNENEKWKRHPPKALDKNKDTNYSPNNFGKINHSTV